MKLPSEILQNLPYFYHKKTHVVFFHFSFRATLYFYLINAIVYEKKKIHRFSYDKNMANFEGFR